MENIKLEDITIKTNLEIKGKDIENLLYCAGQYAGYWCSNAHNLEYESTVKKAMTPKGITCYEVIDESVEWSGKNLKPHTLNLRTIKEGLELMAQESPKFFADILDENADAETGDVFLQYCLLGDIVYG